MQRDYRDAALRDTARIVPLVLLAVTLIPGLLLRSIVAPLMLLCTVLLSFAAFLGVSVLLYTHVLDHGGVAADLFVYIFVFPGPSGTRTGRTPAKCYRSDLLQV